MYYDEQAWNSDRRVKRAIQESRQFNKEQQDLIDLIMKEGESCHE